MAMRLQRLSEDAVALTVPDAAEAQAIAASLRQSGQWREVVAGLDSVTVLFDPQVRALAEVERALQDIIKAHENPSMQAPTEHVIPVHYGGPRGPDFTNVMARTGLDETALIAAHTAGVYKVDMIGFTPGFAYLSGLDAALNVPRLERPRTHVPAGSVGISGTYCGLYALPGPGGWPLIGRTDMTLFDRSGAAPFLIQPGDTIRFTPI